MSFRLWSRAAFVLLTLVASGLATASSAYPSTERAQEYRGQHFAGLRSGGAWTACERGYVIEATGTCTHGPDEAPEGTHFSRPTTGDLQEAMTTAEGTGTTTAVQCVGDGTSGSRVQAIYVRASDVPDRFAEVAPLIAQWAAATDAVFVDSAAKTGGVRNVRWFMPGCQLDVAQVVLAPTSDDDFGATIAAVRSQGFNRTDRKYVLWADAAVYCGIGEFKADDRSGSNNASNVGPNYARVDAPCWGRSEPTEAHELMHMLGGVQYSAPHSNGAGHCSEDYDRMCYKESASAPMTYSCPVEHERLFDCGNDDYFHTNAPSGSYLASHWNAASSVFLSTGSTSTEPAPPPDASTTTSTWTGSVGRKTPTREHLVTMGAGTTDAMLSTGRRSTLTLTLVDAAGTVVAQKTGAQAITLTATIAAGDHRWVVSGSGSYTLTATYPTP